MESVQPTSISSFPASLAFANLSRNEAYQPSTDIHCLSEALDRAALTSAGMTFSNARGQQIHGLRYADIRQQARLLASHLLGLGLDRGDRIGIIADMHPDFVTLFFACQYAGLLAVPLPVITGLGGRQGYEEQLAKVIATSKARAVFGPKSSHASLETAADGVHLKMLGTVETLLAGPRSDRPLIPLAEGEPSHIQFSSGSTQFPKGVLISQKALLANTAAIAEALAIQSDDRIFSWLPFYHDMGLIGCMITPVVTAMPVDYLHTDDFAKRPLQWLQQVSQRRSTITFSPTFGYDICTQRVKSNEMELDLSSLRVVGIGGEMVQPEIMQRFIETFLPYGLDPATLMPCYGMAEITLAASFTPKGRGMKVDHVEKAALLNGIAKPIPANCVTRSFASCGLPLTGNRIDVRDDEGEPLPERRVGRIFISGPGLMDGYDGLPKLNAQMFDEEGWLDTGDMGYLADGHIYLTGRQKDMMIINGRNVWPQDLEWQAEQQIEGLRRRDTAAFVVENDGREVPTLLVQCRLTTEQARHAMKKEITSLLMRYHGVQCEVVMIPPKSLPFTTSGKLSRARAKKAYLAGEYHFSDAYAAA